MQSTLIRPSEVQRREPHAADLEGLFVMGTGIVDYLTVSHQLSRMIESRGERIILCAKVTSIAETSRVVTVDDELGTESAELLISSAGLYGDIIARNNGLKPSVQIIPFRGEYFELKPDRRYLVNVVV